MASKPRSTAPAAKRLLHELKEQTLEPPSFLVSVGPVSDAEILHWEAVMRGIPGTAYGGTTYSFMLARVRF